MQILFIDCAFSGISGDLLVSSLASIVGIDETEKYLQKIVAKIAPDKDIHIHFISKLSQGIKGTYFELELPKKEEDHAHGKPDEIQILKPEQNFHLIEHNHIKIQPNEDHHLHHHHHEYTIQDQIRDMQLALNIESLPSTAKTYAERVLNQIIEAEAEVHGISPDKVHLHEISAIDTILDIVGTTYLLTKLGVFDEMKPMKIYFPSIAVGGGTVKCDHGILPVPAPATSTILTKYQLQIKYGPVETELATPTGVSLLAGLTAMELATQVIELPSLKLEQQGIGVGTKKLENRPNILRINKGTELKSSLKEFSNPIFILETNVDDVSGETLGYVMERLIKAGAHDVSYLSATTKKNRPQIIIKVITDESNISNLSKILMEETGTLGIRLREERRICLPREIIERKINIDGKEFTIHIKRSFSPNGEIFHEKVEFEDIRKIAEQLGLPLRHIDKIVKKQL